MQDCMSEQAGPLSTEYIDTASPIFNLRAHCIDKQTTVDAKRGETGKKKSGIS